MKTRKLNKNGFTLIEVVLVLAIGGLIFLLAFLAFRQASINRRDTQRRSDAGRFISEVANYSGDANGKLPGQTGALSVDQFQTTYMGSTWKDPADNNYKAAASENNATASTVGQNGNDYYYFKAGNKCNGNAMTTGSSGDYAIVLKLEKGVVCRDNGTQ